MGTMTIEYEFKSLDDAQSVLPRISKEYDLNINKLIVFKEDNETYSIDLE